MCMCVYAYTSAHVKGRKPSILTDYNLFRMSLVIFRSMPGGQSELVSRESVVVLLLVTVSSIVVVAIGMKKSIS